MILPKILSYKNIKATFSHCRIFSDPQCLDNEIIDDLEHSPLDNRLRLLERISMSKAKGKYMGLSCIYAKGGVTKAFLKNDNDTIAEGIAHCSIKDNFCRAIGRKYALDNALTAHLGNEWIMSEERKEWMREGWAKKYAGTED